MRGLYALLFKSRGILPDVTARQRPRLLFDMLDGLSEEAEETAPVPDKWGWVYGE